MSFITTFRLVVLYVSLFFSLIVLGLTAHWTQGTREGGIVTDFEVVAFVSSIFAICMIPTFMIVAAIRKGAITSMIAVELAVLTIIWVLYLATSALTAQWSVLLYPLGCGAVRPNLRSWCQQFFVIEALSFIIWISLFLYTATLLTFAIVGQSRGHRVWTISVPEAVFFGQQNQQQGQKMTTTTYAQSAAPVQSMTPVGVPYNPYNTTVPTVPVVQQQTSQYPQV